MAEALKGHGILASYYHVGLKAEEHEQVQNDFIDDKNDVIVATTAFGMGVDKPNVRFVFHYDIAIPLIRTIRKSGEQDAMANRLGRCSSTGHRIWGCNIS